MQEGQVHAFSISSPITLYELTNQCEVSLARLGERINAPGLRWETFLALWDTGATISAISPAVADACGLLPTGLTEVFHIEGSYTAEVYQVNFTLPGGIVFSNLRVTKAEIPGADILIGMDIISRGDFAISNQNGGTKFTFRIPSIEDIDFTTDQHN
ncbi:MAG: hypothetical protein F4X65_13270 [Chloroflexi bacterium]|nr:hypothetical protein [Chloroflexota bacterium]